MIVGFYTDWENLYLTPALVCHNHPGYFMISLSFLNFVLSIEFETNN